MSAVDNKKAKRRKHKASTVVKSNGASLNISNNISQGLQNLSEENEEAERIEKLMDAEDDVEMPLPAFPHGPNPYLDRERCLLCGCERQDPPQADKIIADMDENTKNTDTNAFTQLPLWVCSSCRRAADSEMEKKSGVDPSFMEQDLQLDSSTLSFLPEVNLGANSEPTTPNGTLCTCEACTERRQIEAEHERETHELQKCWTDLRTHVRTVYGSEEPSLTEEEGAQIKELVHRLCSRDPHQLFLRMESQVHEFVIEKKVRLLKQLNCGYKSPPQAKEFISMLLDEYNQLCQVSRLTSETLTDLKEHIKKFNVTWELHNKHLFQSIVYTDQAIHNSLHIVIDQLRRGAASKESYYEDTYPNLLQRFLKFQDEMSVILVVWRDCQQLIEAYNEEQTALKVKQKWLKEDWEFFKAQRKLLEQQVLKKQPKAALSHSMEVQFTETMRNMLTGTKPSADECHCPRCNRKRCPCDECTITHMITCGIINPEALENNNTTHTFNFPHDPNRYVIDVTPPSMSSTTSSSGSSSPIMVDHERLTLPFDDCPHGFENGEDIPGEIEDSQSEDEDEDDDEDEDEEDDEDDEDDEEGNEDNVLETENPIYTPEGSKHESPVPGSETDSIMQAWVEEAEAFKLAEKTDACDCHHCQTQAQQMLKSEDNQCQCHACLQQQGQTVSTSLPQHVPMASRPADFHLYPHIHGYPAGLHGLQQRGIRSILQPQLYDLHGSLRQQKFSKHDFDNPERIQDHLNHAYGDWDNTYDHRIIGHRYSGNLSTDLLPPAPLTSNSPFLSEPLSLATQTTTTITTTTSAFNTISNNHLANTVPKSVDASSAAGPQDPNHDDSCPKIAKCSNPAPPPPNSSKAHGPPCTRPVTLGGNSSALPSRVEKTHSQHCKKHNVPIIGKSVSQPSHNHGNPAVQSHGLQGQPDKNASRNINKEEALRTLRTLGNINTNTNINPHPCSHASARNSSSHIYQTQGMLDHHTGMCASSVPMQTNVNNVSVGTSTVCTDPDCDAHHDDNCDSIDDSCSEKSSSTSTSNQKEGSKYCDCCYCEFFGHGNPPVAQTSKNYAEMRERLRRRLKRRTEAKGGEDSKGELTIENCGADLTDPLELKGLEELLKFINGTEESKKCEEKPASAKAAKRARRKQRLAEEKARVEAEKQKCEDKPLIGETCRPKVIPERGSSSELETEQVTGSLKKKKGKHKEKSTLAVQENSGECQVRLAQPTRVSPPRGENVLNSNYQTSRSRDEAPSPKPYSNKNNSSPSTPTKELKKQEKSPLPTQPQVQTPDRQRRAKIAAKVPPPPVEKIVVLGKSNNVQQQTNVQSGSNNGRKLHPSTPPAHAYQIKPVQINVDKNLIEQASNKKGKKRFEVNSTPPSQPSPQSMRHHNGTVHQQTGNEHPPTSVLTTNGKTSVICSVKDSKIPANGVIPTANGDVFSRQGKNNKMNEKSKQESQEAHKLPEQTKINGKSKKNKKKNKGSDDSRCVDEIFMPRSESDLEAGEMDEVERELEEFKRFCLDTPQPQREKLQVNFNLKDIFAKKKSGMGCS